MLTCVLVIQGLVRPAAGYWTSTDLRPNNYNNMRPPKVNGSEPVDVKVSVEVISLLAVNEFEQVCPHS